jgi:hypothetical protein
MVVQSPAPAERRAIRAPWRSIRGSLGAGLKLAEVRLRIPFFLLFWAVVVGRWDTICNYYDKLTRSVPRQDFGASPVSNDTEYFCPMDPGILSNWPGKCGICNMDLVRRKRGDSAALPGGIVARMQLSPERVQLAGIQTTAVVYEPLARTYRAAGIVGKDGDAFRVPLRLPKRHAAWLKQCTSATIECTEGADFRPTTGLFRFDDQLPQGDDEEFAATVTTSVPPGGIGAGMLVYVSCQVPMANLEPFRDLPTDPPPPLAGEPRRLYACPEHPNNLQTQPGRCPKDENRLEARVLSDLQRVQWWCPMHPKVTASQAGQSCQECGGMILQPRVISFQPRGKVLVVPESAVVDTGNRTIVFVERMPGLFECVEVRLGPRCGDRYPVIKGIEAGQRVATSGAFLLDAETRLNPSVASSYFGAGNRAAASPSSSRPNP